MALGGILATSASAAPNFLVTVSKDNGTVLVEGVSGAVTVEVLRNGVQVGLAEGTAVVSKDYLDRVHAAFRARGKQAWADFQASTETHGIQPMHLDRRDVPGVRSA